MISLTQFIITKDCIKLLIIKSNLVIGNKINNTIVHLNITNILKKIFHYQVSNVNSIILIILIDNKTLINSIKVMNIIHIYNCSNSN